MPKVSVLLANYNGEKHLHEAIESVLEQTYQDFEFVIIDDASTDSSRKVIENYHDKRIKKYYAEKNRNIAYSLNLALSMASGEYIARIDSDDVWELNKLETQVYSMYSFLLNYIAIPGFLKQKTGNIIFLSMLT